MVYIAKDTVESLDPGAILGDSKSVETRQLPIEIDPETDDTKYNWQRGEVVFIDENGYAAPFLETTTGKVPYGVVAKINVIHPTEREKAIHTNSPDSNTVLVVVSGVVGVTYDDALGGEKPSVGDLVNQFGGKYRPNTTTSTPNDVCVGVCDGVAESTDFRTTTAVRVAVLPFGAAPTPGETVSVFCPVDSLKYEPVYYNGIHANTANGEKYPIAVQITPEQCQRFEGFMTDSYEAGTIGKVQISGEIELPYYIPDASSNVVESSRIVRLLDNPNESIFVRTCHTIATVGQFVSLVFGAVSKGSEMVKTIREYRGIATGRASNLRSVNNQLGWVIDPETNKPIGDPEPVITGWITVDVNPQNDLSPASIELGIVPATETAAVGHVYGGTDDKVEEFTDNFTGIPFFGVCVSAELDDLRKAAFAREGNVNVLAASSWQAGDYIDYMRNPIPEPYEPYVARIGIALTDCAAGEMGAVELNPHDPNEYIILDHVKLVDVSHASVDTAVYQVGKNIYVCSQVPPIMYPDGNYISIRGILRHYKKDYISDPAGNNDRAIIQVGGYAWVNTTTRLRHLTGCPVRSLGANWIDAISHEAVGADMAFMQLGTVVSTFALPSQEPDIIMVKLDIRHHPQLALPEPVITGREDVRLDIKKVIPLIKTANNTMAFADPNDQYFTLEGVVDGVYNDEVWREEFITRLVLGYITQSAKNLTLNGATYSIVSGFEFASTTGNRLKINLNSAVPDQWDDPDKQVVGYLIYAFGADTAFKYLLTPLHFFMDSTNARKPTEPTDESTKTNEEVTNNA